jgi:UDP-GlcNAc:undecaprenyl-phosphate GlcNAc-1-phosphate transferase
MSIETNLLNLIYSNKTPYLFFLLSSVAGFIFLFWTKQAKAQWIRYLFYIPANKSQTKTLQLGGLPVNLISMGLLVWLSKQSYVSIAEKNVLLSAIILYVGVLFYGYLDDRFEVKPIIKISAQLFLALTYSLSVARLLQPNNPQWAFIINFLVIIVSINGTNLLDGLDTMSFKIFSGTLIYFGILALICNSPVSLIMSVSLMLILLPFYFLNRAPAKVYLGEIGVGTIAVSGILLANLAFRTLVQTEQPLRASTYAALPLILSCMEVAVSFFRRLINNRSPFKGDKLHIHHILSNHYQLKSSTITNIYFLLQALFCTLGFLIIYKMGSLLGIALVSVTLVVAIFSFGFKFWITKDIIPLNLESLLRKGQREKIKILSGQALNDFQVHIIPEQYNLKIAQRIDENLDLS